MRDRLFGFWIRGTIPLLWTLNAGSCGFSVPFRVHLNFGHSAIVLLKAFRCGLYCVSAFSRRRTVTAGAVPPAAVLYFELYLPVWWFFGRPFQRCAFRRLMVRIRVLLVSPSCMNVALHSLFTSCASWILDGLRSGRFALALPARACWFAPPCYYYPNRALSLKHWRCRSVFFFRGWTLPGVRRFGTGWFAVWANTVRDYACRAPRFILQFRFLCVLVHFI